MCVLVKEGGEKEREKKSLNIYTSINRRGEWGTPTNINNKNKNKNEPNYNNLNKVTVIFRKFHFIFVFFSFFFFFNRIRSIREAPAHLLHTTTIIRNAIKTFVFFNRKKKFLLPATLYVIVLSKTQTFYYDI